MLYHVKGKMPTWKERGRSCDDWIIILHFLTMAQLPWEVVEQIIDDVAAEYHEPNIFQVYHNLKSCALVCHSFLPLCRKHIFAYVILNAHAPRHHTYPTSDDLNRLLSNSPHLAVYIRELKYHVSKKEFVVKRLPWLLAMFKKLVKLQKLTIRYSPSSRCKKLDWMSSFSRKVLLPLLHFPTLTGIRLSHIQNFPLADLAGCVNLKHLDIYFLEFSKDVGNFLEALPAAPAVLEWLAIVEGNVRSVQQLCHARRPDGKPIIDLSSLKEIRAVISRVDIMTELFGMWRNLHKIKLSGMSLLTSVIHLTFTFVL